MELQEFVEQGYKIYAQVPMVETQNINLDDMIGGEDVGDCCEDTIDSWIDDGANAPRVSYDIIDPYGDLISGYDANLLSDADVREFIANL